MANFLLFFIIFVFGAIEFGLAAKDLSKKNYFWFGYELMTGILMTDWLINNWLVM